MKIKLTKTQNQIPQLAEVLKTNTPLSLPPHSILETPSDFQIRFNFSGAAQNSLKAALSSDFRRLHVVGTKHLHDSIAEFLWIFNLPTNVATDEIFVVDRINAQVIHIPKSCARPIATTSVRIESDRYAV